MLEIIRKTILKMYDVKLFIENIEYVIERGDEPECSLDLKDVTRVEFTCYKNFIDAYLENKNYKFTDITDFFLNMKIGEKTLSGIWQEVVSITDDIGMIDFTETPEENFGVNGSSVRRYTD